MYFLFDLQAVDLDELFETGVSARRTPTPNLYLRIHDLGYFLVLNQTIDLDAIFKTGVHARSTPTPDCHLRIHDIFPVPKPDCRLVKTGVHAM